MAALTVPFWLRVPDLFCGPIAASSVTVPVPVMFTPLFTVRPPLVARVLSAASTTLAAVTFAATVRLPVGNAMAPDTSV